jgi:hypothetical protein
MNSLQEELIELFLGKARESDLGRAEACSDCLFLIGPDISLFLKKVLINLLKNFFYSYVHTMFGSFLPP